MLTNTEMVKHISDNQYIADMRFIGAENYMSVVGLLRTLFKFEQDPAVIGILRTKKNKFSKPVTKEVWTKSDDTWTQLS